MRDRLIYLRSIASMKWRLFFAATLTSFVGYSQSPASSDTATVQNLIRASRKFQWIDSYRSLNYADSALTLAYQIGFPVGVARAKNQQGFAHWTFGDNEIAIQSALEALQICRDRNVPLIQAESQYILARAYMDLAERAKAWDAIVEAEALAVKQNDWELLCSIYNLMGVIQFIDSNQDSALTLYNKAFELGKSHSVDPINFPRIISNIGECYAVENPALAFTYFNRALDLANETGNQVAKASITAIVGHAWLRGNDLTKAEANLDAALRLARSLGLRRVVRHAYSGLVDIKLRLGKGNEAIVYLRKYYDVRDSLLNTSKMRQVVEMEAKHELQLKEQNIRILESEQKIQRLWNNLLLGLVVVVLLVSVGIYLMQRYRYRKNRELLNLEIDYLTQQHKRTVNTFKATLADDPNESLESHDQKLLRKAITVVETNIGDAQFSVEKMAEEMNMSRTNLHRRIKSITGFPPSELIRSIRLRRAAKLIASKVDSVSQIALMVGFDDYSHFSKSFKKHFGVSPTNYEEQHKGPTSDVSR